MAEATITWFVGVDWGSEGHQTCLLDAHGTIVGERECSHSAAGLAELGDWLLSIAGSANAVGISIEDRCLQVGDPRFIELRTWSRLAEELGSKRSSVAAKGPGLSLMELSTSPALLISLLSLPNCLRRPTSPNCTSWHRWTAGHGDACVASSGSSGRRGAIGDLAVCASGAVPVRCRCCQAACQDAPER